MNHRPCYLLKSKRDRLPLKTAFFYFNRWGLCRDAIQKLRWNWSNAKIIAKKAGYKTSSTDLVANFDKKLLDFNPVQNAYFDIEK